MLESTSVHCVHEGAFRGRRGSGALLELELQVKHWTWLETELGPLQKQQAVTLSC